MKVAMLVNGFPEISETFLLNLFLALIKNGVAVEVYAAVTSTSARRHALFSTFPTESIHCLNIPRSRLKRAIKVPIMFFKNFLRNPACCLRALSVKQYGSQAKNFKTLFFLDALSGKQFDIIHCQFGENGLIGAFLKDCSICHHFVVTFHGHDIIVAPKLYGHSLYTHMLQTTDFVTVGSNYIFNLLMNHYGYPQKTAVIPMGVFVAPFTKTEWGNYFLSVGRLVEYKGFEYAIKAFAGIKQQYPRIKYLIAGEGPHRQYLTDIIHEHDLDATVFLLGEKTDAELENLYRKAYTFIMPSTTGSDGSEEGQGLVVQEAESWELPVIGTDNGGIPEGIANEKSGFIVPQKNAQVICEKVIFLIEHPEVAKQQGKEGRCLVQKKYSIDVIAQQFIEVYRKLT
jgi:colanic acid/amylovoran biosynthesis glycosyltransferase